MNKHGRLKTNETVLKLYLKAKPHGSCYKNTKKKKTFIRPQQDREMHYQS